MWQSYLNGILVAAGLIIAIGAQNAFVLAQSLRREHHLSVAALCVFCDAVLVSLGVFGLAKLLLENPTLLAIARWGGIAFLTWYGGGGGGGGGGGRGGGGARGGGGGLGPRPGGHIYV
ncbi:LysE family transporter, partial [Pseudomonas aeruginosa]|uniref:LysE/ArgO family amino acid transporter n=1 Tax=Pseudomonas aeruginosa TaxID=287 RepID=UPI0039BE3902